MKSAVRGRLSEAARGKLFVLIITNFVDMVGVLMIIPLLPYYARELGAGSLMVAAIFGSFKAAQLLSAPLWGRFSDKYGRRPALLVGLTASAIAYIVFAFAGSIGLLLLSRVVQGAGGGTVGVIQAYVADSVEQKNRAKALGWLSSAANVGVAIGPVIGSVALLRFGKHGPGLTAAALCLVNILFAWTYLKESRDVKDVPEKKPRASREAIARVVTHATEPASRHISSRERGLYMGVQQTFGGLARVLIPLWAGFSYDRYGKTIPFFTSAGLVVVALFLNFGLDDGKDAQQPTTPAPSEVAA